MEDHRKPQQGPSKGRRQIRDIPERIKWILLLLLLLLLGAQYGMRPERTGVPWIILLIILLLIALIILLIKVQRDLKCALTEPTGCTEEQPDAATGQMIVKVKGTATGIMFGSYELEVRRIPFPAPIPGIVSYPGGGSSGSVPVIGGELGQINTTSLIDGAYEVKLVVYPIGPGSPKSCTSIFHLLKAVVYIGRVAGLPTLSMSPVPNNPNPFDPAAEIGGAAPVSVGGGITMEGSAYIYECDDRKIKKYEIRYARVTAPGAEPTQPATGDPIPATWPAAQRAVLFEYTLPDMYQPWTRIGMAPTHLINTWKSFTLPPTFYKLNATSWDSSAAGSGRYSLLLTAEDTMGKPYHDIQHLWIDNKPIKGKIVKFQWFDPKTSTWEDIPACTDLSMKRFGKVRIMGVAWDPLIDDSVPFWPPTKPNDNFDHYDVSCAKQFSPSPILLNSDPNRVPALPAAPPAVLPMPTPTDLDAGELAIWDLTALAALPVGDPNRLAPGESCTYIVYLGVTDTTLVGPNHHHMSHQVPVKVINDL